MGGAARPLQCARRWSLQGGDVGGSRAARFVMGAGADGKLSGGDALPWRGKTDGDQEPKDAAHRCRGGRGSAGFARRRGRSRSAPAPMDCRARSCEPSLAGPRTCARSDQAAAAGLARKFSDQAEARAGWLCWWGRRPFGPGGKAPKPDRVWLTLLASPECRPARDARPAPPVGGAPAQALPCGSLTVGSRSFPASVARNIAAKPTPSGNRWSPMDRCPWSRR